MRMKGNVDYQLKIYNDKDVDIIPMNNTITNEIPNIQQWMKTLSTHIKTKLDNPERRAFAIKMVSKIGDVVGTGISNVPAILYKDRDYKVNYLSNDYKYHLEKDEPILFLDIESQFERLPTGVYIGSQLGNQLGTKSIQKQTWNFKSLKVNKNTKLRLTIKENGPFGTYDDVVIEQIINNNIPDLETWLSLMDQTKVKFNPSNPNRNERQYYLELL